MKIVEFFVCFLLILLSCSQKGRAVVRSCCLAVLQSKGSCGH